MRTGPLPGMIVQWLRFGWRCGKAACIVAAEPGSSIKIKEYMLVL